MARVRKGGFSLLEVLIVGTLLFFFLSLVCDILILGYQSQVKTAQKQSDLRSAAVDLDRLGRELSACDKLYSPDPTQPPLSTWGSISPPFVLRTVDATGKIVVGYSLNNTTNTLTRNLFNNAYDPANPASQTIQESKPVLQNNDQAFLFTPLNPSLALGVPFVQLDVTLVSCPNQPLTLQMRVRGL